MSSYFEKLNGRFNFDIPQPVAQRAQLGRERVRTIRKSLEEMLLLFGNAPAARQSLYFGFGLPIKMSIGMFYCSKIHVKRYFAEVAFGRLKAHTNSYA